MMTKPWNEHRTTITRLYIDDGLKLEEVRDIMKAKYNFEASIRSYRQHFDHWNIGKYNCKKRQRRRQAMSRPALLSPPQTPLVEMATPLRFAHQGGIIVGPVRLPSPVSLSARSSISSVHSPEQRPLPDISSSSPQHKMIHIPRFPPCFQGHSSNTMLIHDKTASSVVAFQEDMQAALRSPNMTESMLPPMALDHTPIKTEARYSPMALDHTHIKTEARYSSMALDHTPIKTEPRYIPQAAYSETTNWNVPRSNVPASFYAAREEGNNYSLYTTGPRAHAEPFPGAASPPRCMDHSTALRSPPLVSSLPKGKEFDPANGNKSIQEQQMTNGNPHFQALGSNQATTPVG